jgi:hypothetical protein
MPDGIVCESGVRVSKRQQFFPRRRLRLRNRDGGNDN